MTNLLTETEPPYFRIYQSLQRVREAFHREGRISDSNAKLDETIKFLVVHYGHYRGLVAETDFRKLSAYETFNVRLLNHVFSKVASRSLFTRTGMGSIFGDSPSTLFREGDEAMAYELFKVTGQAFSTQNSNDTSFDILNEAFGHFVRDNFRNNIEDAQYMTPTEVVDFMVSMAFDLTRDLIHENDDDFLVADPSCGVGSFLVTCRSSFAKFLGTSCERKLRCIGQDKVERMVRLCAINFILSDSLIDDVFLGNSIDDGSAISNFNGKIDLILTNPPFGARFSSATLKQTCSNSTPFFANALPSNRLVDSELLFLDRYLTLLKPGGVCLAVVPDGVISAKGLAAMTRQHLARKSELIGVVELPSVTFAQAGTRTKTAILAFRKSFAPRRAYPVFFSEATDIGFKVAKRKGVTVKKSQGTNQLPKILRQFKARAIAEESVGQPARNGFFRELSPKDLLAWTPRMMLFDRKTLERRTKVELVPLSELTEPPVRRRTRQYSKGTYFISVLHVIGEAILDIPGIRSYQPITPGLPVSPGEVIVSRLNPRIPRVAVVPELGGEILCSSEYEVLTPRSSVSAYLIAFLLLSPIVQEQIQSLTAGTSASHSRIKPRKLYDVLVPDIRCSQSYGFQTALERYRKCVRGVTTSLVEIEKIRKSLDMSIQQPMPLD